MKSNRTAARIVGALFLTSNVTFILGAAIFIESILGAPDYLIQVSANRTQVMMGALLEIVNGIAYVGIAVLMFPILKQRFESLTFGYVAFRVVEFIMQIAGDLSPIALVRVSQEFVRVGAPEASAYQPLGTLLLAERASAFLMVSVVFGLSALMFYFMLYKAKLIPRILSVWGLIGAILVLISFLVDMFDLSLSPGIETILGLPMLLNEVFLGIWLIFKGFNSSATDSETATTDINPLQMRTANGGES